MSDERRHLAAALADRYALQDELGRGGMATVYLATDLRHDRRVALKVLRPELAAVLGGERFLREIRTTAGLSHPHILPLLDSGDADGVLFYVMPFVAGESLRDRLLREQQLPLEEAVHIAREVADALGYAHSRGVIHRDIKPENILLESGHALVADFGIARAIGEVDDQRLTSTGLAIGTPAYMSPEQAAGESDLDGRSDLYSLGCVLYEMLAGEPPHAGPTAQASIARRLSAPPVSVRALRDTVPEALDGILRRALARIPADRYGTAAQLATDLAQAGPGPGAADGTDRRKAEGSSGSRRRIGSAVAVLLVLGAVMAAVIVAVRNRPPPAAAPGAGPPEPAVAVMPFRTVGADPDFWGEGMVDMLSFNLDGIVGLRKIDPASVMSAWQSGGGDPDASAIDVARRLGAAIVVTGSAVRLGPAIRLTADVLDVGTGGTIGSVRADGHPDSATTLVDRLTLELLRSGLITGTADVYEIDLRRVTTGSLPALKAYLDGERKYRRGMWSEALHDYQRALDSDSTFAHALFRAVNALMWGGGAFELIPEYGERLARHMDRVPEREAWLFGAAVSNDPASIERLRAFTRRYPDDAGGWFALGDKLTHLGGVALERADTYRAPFERSIALNPYQAEPYQHLIELAFVQLDSARARSLIDSLTALGLGGDPGCTYALGADLVWGEAAARSAAIAALDTVTAGAAMFSCVQAPLAAPPDAMDAVARMYERHLRSATHRDTLRVLLWRFLQGPVPRGRIAAARRSLSLTSASILAPPVMRVYAARWELMLHLSGFPDSVRAEDAADVLRRSRAADRAVSDRVPDPTTDLFWLGALAIDDGRWTDAETIQRTLMARSEELATADNSAWAEWTAGYAAVLDAFEGLMRGERRRLPEFEVALRRLPPHGYTWEQPQLYLRYRVGMLLREWGDLQRAEQYFLTFRPYDYFYTSLAELQLGRISEAAGRGGEAGLHYDRFIRWWELADPEYRPLADEAHEAIARLMRERS